MNNRSLLKIFTMILSVLVCFGLLSRAKAGTNLGGGNTANGFNALNSLTTGGFNTADGWFSEAFLTEGFFNTAQGAGSLDVNINGNSNSAFGTAALLLNLGNLADNNTAVGTNALLFNSFSTTDPATAVENTGVGFSALNANVDGGENTAVGAHALEALNGGNDNTVLGWSAADNYTSVEFGNIAIGAGEVGVTGESNTVRIGTTGPTQGILVKGGVGINAVTIGTGVASQGFSVVETILGNVMGLGRGLPAIAGSQTFIGGVVGQPQPIGGTVVGVTIQTAAGAQFQRLGVNVSSRRFKEDIKPMNELSEAIYKLKPVTYRVKKEIDPAQPTAFGLIAEDVAETCPHLALSMDGQPYSVHYEEVNVMLLNEFLKEHKKVEEQQASISQLKSEMQTLVAQLKEQAAQIQRVSAQLEVSKRAPQVVVNKP